jgi:hypothetical protein
MAEAEPTLTRHDVEAKIVKRCWEDAAFRKEFTADPAGAFVKYLQVPAAGLPKIVVHEEPAGSWHIVLPPKPAQAGELSEAELEKVAGGVAAVGQVPASFPPELTPIVIAPSAPPIPSSIGPHPPTW